MRMRLPVAIEPRDGHPALGVALLADHAMAAGALVVDRTRGPETDRAGAGGAAELEDLLGGPDGETHREDHFFAAFFFFGT
jgi:hypothetical protein